MMASYDEYGKVVVRMMTRALCVVVLFALSARADYRPDRDGADAKIGLDVVDTEGRPVDGAEVVFRIFTTLDDCYKEVRRCDSNGRCEIGVNTCGEVTAVVNKSGFYTSWKKLEYKDLSWNESVKERKWSRDAVENRIMLKPVVNPLKHIRGVIRFKTPPVRNEPMLFDVFKFDWCEPYGQGKAGDFAITCFQTTNDVNQRLYGFQIRAGNGVDGFVKRNVDAWSRYRHDLVADEKAEYLKTLKFGWVPDGMGGMTKYGDFTENDYLVFRVRTVTNQVGEVVHANYGIIYESLQYGRRLTIGGHVNPADNDKSLEDDWAYRHMEKAGE